MLNRPLLKLRRILTIAPFILGTALGIANTEAWAIQGLISPLDVGGSDQLLALAGLRPLWEPQVSVRLSISPGAWRWTAPTCPEVLANPLLPTTSSVS